MERWIPPGHLITVTRQPSVLSNKSTTYNTIDTINEEAKEYEDPDYLYGQKNSTRQSAMNPPSPSNTATDSSPSPPSYPPPMTLRGTLKPTHIAIHQTRDSPRWRGMAMGLVMGGVLLLMLLSVILFLVMGSRAHNFSQNIRSPSSPNSSPYSFATPEQEDLARRADMEVSPNYLLTLMITKRKFCLFEASTDDVAHSMESYKEEHIDSARLLIHTNLSHSGVPVHPLQFQRYARLLGVDNDCHIVLYDKGQMIWSTYAAWIFKLFGTKRVSLLAGGFIAWKAAQSRSAQYTTQHGVPPEVTRQGDFTSSWNDSLIITFDDVFLNSEIATFDLVDAQTKEEYDGTSPGALFGHIRGAASLPIDAVFDWSAGRWLPISDLAEIFRKIGLSQQRPVIVYCSTSVRASMLWWSLTRLGFGARIYFGGWPEWVVRAPDYLKVMPQSQMTRGLR